MTAGQPELAAPVCLDDVRRMAKETLAPDIWAFVEGGSGAETTLAANRAAFDSVALLPRVLTGVSTSDTTGSLVHSEVAMPVAIAPMAYQRLVHPDGELAAASAARVAGVPFVLSTLSSCRIEEVTAIGATTWFQLYWLRDDAQVEELVRSADQLGCAALVVTVDVPIMGRRHRDMRNEFVLPSDVQAVNLHPGSTRETHVRTQGASAVATHTSAAFAPGLTWWDLERLREWTKLPLVVKGILDPRDARLAVQAGADAIVVSNHGGRQLDGAVPSIVALQAAVQEVADARAVLLDSGVRSGTDVLRALALGASGVLVGRPVLWGLAAAGERGVAQVLSLLQAELREAMILAGCADLVAAGRLGTREVGFDAPYD